MEIDIFFGGKVYISKGGVFEVSQESYWVISIKVAQSALRAKIVPKLQKGTDFDSNYISYSGNLFSILACCQGAIDGHFWGMIKGTLCYN